MKFSEKWLREWVNPAVSTDELTHLLTMAGLEVDSVAPAGGEFSGVIVGEVLAMEAHPNADKLRVCQVKAGEGDVRQVVCGAANVHVGMRAPLAQVGASVPGLKIKRAKLRQVESLGMLCSAKELGLAESADGLLPLPSDAVVGTDMRDYLGLDDVVIDVDLTPNRGDCLGMVGIAREVGVLTRTDLSAPEMAAVAASVDDRFPVRIDAPQDCPRYLGRVIRGVNPQAETPLWMQERLRRGGIRSLGPLVDVTNYVLLELGQPMHAFDLARLSGRIEVRRAKANEKLVLLDSKTLELDDDTLVIADSKGPLALAGIMGGEMSGCSDETHDVFLECAFFAPLAIAGRARKYGLHTDSSFRFERGVDPQIQRTAIERATRLLIDIAGGEAGPVVETCSEADVPKAPTISLRAARIRRLLGVEFAQDEVEEILTRLGMSLTKTDDGWTVQAPSYRFDMAIEPDLIEELGRIHGYDNIPSVLPAAHMVMPEASEGRLPLARFREVLVARGYHEAITYSFVDPRVHTLIAPDTTPVALANPISADLSVMRTSIWPGLLNAVVHNLKRQQPRVRLFESGLIFVKGGDGLAQVNRLSGVICGPVRDEQWSSQNRMVDFFDVKGDVESLLTAAGHKGSVRYEVAEHPALHPGQAARIVRDGRELGLLGALHPAVAETLDIKTPCYVFELDLDAISARELPVFQALSKFPSIRRDLAVVVDASVSSATLSDTIRKSAGDLLSAVKVFDLYTGKGIETGRKSIALGLILQDSSRTLTDVDVDEVVARVTAGLCESHGATLRD
ncbi:MAG: phenylalanine--tRNA ligase subunit beta [Gammaproteobacteria bacterium]|nr:phenylalanine--tRNA ligase subunit beta [Gammaproteobacteria bacterium]MCP5135346.1 phenylalanine--tRNA ligase subunit beta [Gammaproteobacteria bacterium]